MSIKGGKHETGLGKIDGMILIVMFKALMLIVYIAAAFDKISTVLNVFFLFHSKGCTPDV